MRLKPDAAEPAAPVRLRPEQVIRGKLVDIRGEPAAGVEVQLNHVFHASRSAGVGDFDGIGGGFHQLWDVPPEELRAWPKPVTTDDQGRFTLAGIARGLTVRLEVRDIRFARQRFDVETDFGDGPKEVNLALQPATIIEGRALAADTGQPFAHAVIAVRASFRSRPGLFDAKFRADDQGRFKVTPFPGDRFRISVFPREGEPYPARGVEIAWTTGNVRQELDVNLPRGVLIEGNVIEEGTDQPVAGACVQYFPTRRPDSLNYGDEAIVASNENGSFGVAVPPGKGYLLVVGPTLDYVPKEIGSRTLSENGRPGGWRHYAHDIIAYEVIEGEGPRKVTATLRRGKLLRGRVVGPEGQTVENAVVFSRQQIEFTNLVWLGHNLIHVRDGHFELPGFDPEQATPVYFLDAFHQWGAAVELSGKQAGEEMTIQLQPCVKAKARFVGPDRNPIANLPLWQSFEMLMTPGSHTLTQLTQPETERAGPIADSVLMRGVDFKHYGNDFATDAEGRVTLAGLIPGALYRISDFSTNRALGKGVQIRTDFTVKPGETLDLGDILIEKPPG